MEADSSTSQRNRRNTGENKQNKERCQSEKTIRRQIEEINGGGTCGKADAHMYEPPRSRSRQN